MATERFTVTGEHLKLLRNAHLVWRGEGAGAPAVNANRPYGSTSIEADIAEILGKYAGNSGVLRAIHQQTGIALQIVLCTGKFETGTYERCDEDGHVWIKVRSGKGSGDSTRIVSSSST